jgi:predicted transcriptional regulator of viral defense system
VDRKSNILKLINKNLFMTATEALKHGIGRMALSRMVAKGELLSTERGVYSTTLDWLTDPLKKYLPACTLYPEAIISGISALTYYDLTDEEERKIWITIPIHQVVRNAKYRAVRAQGSSYSLGIQTFKFGKRHVKIYDIEKTVVDAFKYQTEEVAYKALKGYLKRKEKNVNKLCRYAKKLGKPLEDKVRFFLADE